MSGSGWEWKSSTCGTQGAEGVPSRLRYQPGNWGDLLKGLWACLVVERLLPGLSRDFQLLDPFAGAPEYALDPQVRAQWMGMPANPFLEAQAAFVARGNVASTAALLGMLCGARNRGVCLSVFEVDPGRRERWRGVPGARILDLAGGEEVLLPGSALADTADLLLVDPYDLFDRWGLFLPGMLKIAKRIPVLAYLCNKSPRGPGSLDQYERFRGQLAAGLHSSQAFLVGRLPSDARLPRAFHEVVLLGPRPLVAECGEVLEGQTGRLAAWLALRGAFEGGP